MAYMTTTTDPRGVTTITLNRPDQFNTMDRGFMDEMSLTLKNLTSRTRVVVIDAAGKHFCAGADIHWMKDSIGLSDEQNIKDAMVLSDMLDTLNSLHRPTIARVHGAALGGGTGLVCCCDIVVASESAVFAFSEVRLGIMPATISPYALAAIGPRSARRYFMTGERIDAVDAYRLGLVHDVCSFDNLDNRVEEHVAQLLASGPQAQDATKRLITDIAGATVDTALREDLARRLATIRASDEAQEGLGAFLDKRKPTWMTS